MHKMHPYPSHIVCFSHFLLFTSSISLFSALAPVLLYVLIKYGSRVSECLLGRLLTSLQAARTKHYKVMPCSKFLVIGHS